MQIPQTDSTILKQQIENHLSTIRKEFKILSSLEILAQRSRTTIKSDKQTVHNLVLKVFKGEVSSDSPLGKFLTKQKTVMPHEDDASYLETISRIISEEFLCEDGSYGLTIRGGVEQISLGYSKEVGDKVWAEIQDDITKICNDYFGITPFFDGYKSGFPEMGFYMNSKWEEKDGVIVQIQK